MKYRAIDIDITKVDRGVGKGRVSWPFKRMEVGETIIITDQESYLYVQRRAHAYAARTGKSFVTRTTDDGLIVKRVR